MNQVALFGTWLKQQRKARRLTQVDLAERLACSPVLVQKIEAGERTASSQLAVLIAEWLGVHHKRHHLFLDFARGQLDIAQAEVIFGYAVVAPATFSSGNLPRLPTPITSLVGRNVEVHRVERLLFGKEPRLLTLTGPPGIGKTRLALHVAHDVLDRGDHFKDGVFFVSLASIADPDLVVTTIAQALSMHDKNAKSMLGNLQESLGSKEALLVLDNFEQVLDASPVVLQLLGSCPGLKVLITSREALHVSGEQRFPVPALVTADPSNLPPIQTLGSVPAIALFLERALAVKSDFALSEQNAWAVAAICARLDGLPLAIELAATRVRLLSPQEMQSRLDSQLSMLTGGPRNLPARQRTLRAAVDWSYNLLNEGEQTLFARLGVFVGGCTLAAAEAICNAESDLSAGSSIPDLSFGVQEVIESLLDKSLLRREEGIDGESRFTMLEMLREYAVGRLTEKGEFEIIGRLHAEYYLALAEASMPEMRGPTQVDWFSRVEREQDNMRVALRWAEANFETTLGLRLALTLWWFWTVRGNVTEAGRWLDGPLAHEGIEPSLRAEALNAAGQVAWARGDLHLADSYLEESLALYNDVADSLGAGGTLRMIANLARDRGDYARSHSYYEQSLAILDEVGDAMGMALLLISMGENARCEDDYGAARSFYERGMKMCRDLRAKQLVAVCLSNLGNVEHHEEHDGLAKVLFKESLQLQRELREKLVIAECLVGLGSIARSEVQPERAGRLLAAAAVMLRSTGLQQNRINRQDNEQEVIELRRLVDPPTFERLWTEGQDMTVEQAIEYALQEV